ncbi:MAG: Rrf2 family transcriptional regulator [Krumholzibacteria bacterium]|nr:Rrf2 family transcriptional regulator [Candidatus Krumholzibacteria bacterium]
MRVNTKVRYGLRAILQVADAYGGEPVPVSAISQTQEISGKYLEQVIGSLRRAELVTSRKGVRGGYTLARDPKEISLWEIITALDSQTALVDCVLEPEVCDRSDDCLTRSIWTLLSRRMEEFWTSFTLADLLATMREAGDGRLQQLAELEKGD